ncbi:MAG: polysaccharide biosynthesis/export family protein [Gemmatimonas sp.]
MVTATRMYRLSIALIAAALASVNAGAQQMPASVPVASSGAETTVAPLQIGDVLRVLVWREPTLSGDFAVDQDGLVTVPMVGARKASGVPWTQLRDSIMAVYSRELRTPTVTLTPLRRVFVLGSVLRPGMYMLDPTFGLGGAISAAGGANPEGNLERIRVVREGKIVAKGIPASSTPDQYQMLSGDQMFVERRSWLDRNSTLLLTSVISLAGIAVTLAARN